METIDFQAHNEEVKALWSDYYNGGNKRVPMTIAANPRIILLDPSLNSQGISFENYFNDPEIMSSIQFQFVEYRDTALQYDHIMGLDYIDFPLYVDYQNVMEPEYFGCPIICQKNSDPGCLPILNDTNKYEYLKNIRNPISGLFERAIEFYDFFKGLKEKGFTYKQKPISSVFEPGEGTDGPFTNACSVRGTTNMCLDLYCDERFAFELLDYITEHTIARIKAFRKYFGHPEKSDRFYFADDSIALLSTDDYVKFVLPFHKKLYRELSTGKYPGMVHLCGDATRHFKVICEELNIKSFDTGFPVKHGELQKALGADVQISGGVHVDVLLRGTADTIETETKRILKEVKPLTHKFIIKEANNLSPKTPPENIAAMYGAVKKYGCF